MRMRIAILAMIPLLSLSGEVKKTRKVAPAAAAKKVSQRTVPAGAEQIDANTWRHADAQGKTWIYKRTPFGIMKSPAKEAAKTATGSAGDLTAVEDGDQVRFARRTPFGEVNWERKKTELNETERAALERARKKQEGETAGAK